jgi:hypothetical protein
VHREVHDGLEKGLGTGLQVGDLEGEFAQGERGPIPQMATTCFQPWESCLKIHENYECFWLYIYVLRYFYFFPSTSFKFSSPLPRGSGLA